MTRQARQISSCGVQELAAQSVLYEIALPLVCRLGATPGSSIVTEGLSSAECCPLLSAVLPAVAVPGQQSSCHRDPLSGILPTGSLQCVLHGVALQDNADASNSYRMWMPEF